MITGGIFLLFQLRKERLVTISMLFSIVRIIKFIYSPTINLSTLITYSVGGRNCRIQQLIGIAFLLNILMLLLKEKMGKLIFSQEQNFSAIAVVITIKLKIDILILLTGIGEMQLITLPKLVKLMLLLSSYLKQNPRIIIQKLQILSYLNLEQTHWRSQNLVKLIKFGFSIAMVIQLLINKTKILP